MYQCFWIDLDLSCDIVEMISRYNCFFLSPRYLVSLSHWFPSMKLHFFCLLDTARRKNWNKERCNYLPASCSLFFCRIMSRRKTCHRFSFFHHPTFFDVVIVWSLKIRSLLIKKKRYISLAPFYGGCILVNCRFPFPPFFKFSNNQQQKPI